jgi:hypothetical protein
MTRRRSFIALLGAVVLLGACADESTSGSGGGGDGGGGLSAEEQAYADAFAVGLEDDEDGFGVAPDDAQCMADAVMAELGVEPFEDAGVEPGDIEPAADSSPGALLGSGAVTDAQANAILDEWEDCVDVLDMLVASGGSEFELDPEGEACFRDGLAEGELYRGLLLSSFKNEDAEPDQETIAALLTVLEDCGGDDGGPLVDGIAAELRAGTALTEEQARCLAQGVIDEIGVDRMSELFGSGAFEDLDADGQSEVTGALLQAAAACDVPLSAFG